jgi:hypothetical protein
MPGSKKRHKKNGDKKTGTDLFLEAKPAKPAQQNRDRFILK